jgi:hypothetical protein
MQILVLIYHKNDMMESINHSGFKLAIIQHRILPSLAPSPSNRLISAIANRSYCFQFIMTG